MSKDPGRILIFDTTLRDGEQSPGASLNLEEKLAIAHQLARLGVDVIEAGFPFASPGDFKAVNKIANDSYEPEYGARPLSRELRRQIENPLAAKLLEDNFKNKKNITIKLIPAKTDEIVFKPS